MTALACHVPASATTSPLVTNEHHRVRAASNLCSLPRPTVGPAFVATPLCRAGIITRQASSCTRTAVLQGIDFRMITALAWRTNDNRCNAG